MVTEVERALLTSLQMFRDGIEKIPDEAWRTGPDDYFVPVRLAYHILGGLEWLASRKGMKEHLQSCRYSLDGWKGPVEHLPGRQQTLDELDWVTARVKEWLAEEAVAERADMEKALYFLRHTEHHLGEFAATARLLHCERPAWIYLKRAPASLLEKAQEASRS